MHSHFKFKGEDFEQYFLELMDGRRKEWYDRILIDILFIASRFYRMVTQFRIWMYDKRVIRNRALGCLVVSIGNLSCGGTGKTPVVEVFARTLSEKGRRVAILSRGYRSKKRSFLFRLMQRFRSQKIELPPKIVSDGHNLLLESDYAGDEPYMLASNLRDVAVLVDKDRVKSGLYAVEQYQSDVIILDDGFQYLMLKPHINIVLVDSTDPFGNGNTLPRGILREPIKNIRRADYIFLTKSDGSHKLRHLKNFLRRHTRRAEIIECCHKPKHLVKMFSGAEQESLEKLKNAKVAALSAIAKPESFERFLEQFGAELVLKDHYADH
ncbi:MAG: tetraacyldisaccharide 4'-kinase, partial [Victivallales bacterium]|nr:tetraacyldisaccharide 4'-kinase [Victivallales bacterium]